MGQRTSSSQGGGFVIGMIVIGMIVLVGKGGGEGVSAGVSEGEGVVVSDGVGGGVGPQVQVQVVAVPHISNSPTDATIIAGPGRLSLSSVMYMRYSKNTAGFAMT